MHFVVESTGGQLDVTPKATAKHLWAEIDQLGGDDDLYRDGDRLIEQHTESGRERGTLTFAGFQKRLTIAKNRRK